MPKFEPLPMKLVPDYSVVIEKAKKNGFVLLQKDLNYNTLHTTARRHGYGVRKVYGADTGEHIGWRVSPIKSHKRKESIDEASNTN